MDSKVKTVILIILITSVILIGISIGICFSTNSKLVKDNITASNTTTTTSSTTLTTTITTTATTSTTPTATTTTTPCTNLSTVHEESCYWFGCETMTFYETVDLCKGLGAAIVNIEALEENEFVKNYLRNITGGHSWLDMTDEVKEMVWRRFTGEPNTFFDWAPHEPNNLHNNADCGIFNVNYNYQHDDVNCGTQNYPICEFITTE